MKDRKIKLYHHLLLLLRLQMGLLKDCLGKKIIECNILVVLPRHGKKNYFCNLIEKKKCCSIALILLEGKCDKCILCFDYCI